jgi:ATP-dependent Clp protease ATP-binding subunit ClpA
MRLPDRLSDLCRVAVKRAQEEASERGADFYDVGHLLMAILMLPESLAFRILAAKGANPAVIRARLEERLPRMPARAGITARISLPASKAINQAVEEAQALGQSIVGTEHMLLAMLAMEDGAAYRVLAESGIDLAATRQWVGEQGEHEMRARREVAPAVGVFQWGCLDFAARSAIQHAISFARSLGGSEFTPLHLVFGCIQALPDYMREALRERGVDLVRREEAVRKRLSALPEPDEGATMPPDAAAKDVLAHALLLAWRRDGNAIGLSDLILALYERGDSAVYTSLQDSGLKAGDLNRLR